jgi:hypothetical protein
MRLLEDEIWKYDGKPNSDENDSERKVYDVKA